MSLGIPTSYVSHGKPEVILARLGLDAIGIAESVRLAIARLATAPERRSKGAGGTVPAGRARGLAAR